MQLKITFFHLQFQAVSIYIYHIRTHATGQLFVRGPWECFKWFRFSCHCKIHFAAVQLTEQKELEMAEGGRNVHESDNSAFIANLCIQLWMYVHVLLYFIPLLHRILEACQYVDLCFHALPLPCSHTVWHAIPTSFIQF